MTVDLSDGRILEVYFHHEQYVRGERPISPAGDSFIVAATHCEVYLDPEETVAAGAGAKPIGVGDSLCLAGDPFDRSVGRKISLTRALNYAGLERDIRAEVWAEYWKRHSR